MQKGGQENACVQAIYSLQTQVDWSGSRKCHGTRPHTKKQRNADDSGIRCATSYGLQGPKSSKKWSVVLAGFTTIQQAGSDK